MTPATLIFHSCHHHASLTRPLARGALRLVHVLLTLHLLSQKHTHKDVCLSTIASISGVALAVSVVRVYSHFA